MSEVDRFARVRGLQPGGHLRVIAPSGTLDRAAIERGVARLRERYTVTYDESIFDRDGYFAGSDARRLDELHAALRDPAVDAIVCARGGYGAMRLLPGIELELVRAAKKLLVGFSDVTALHAMWQRAGLRSLHASMVGGVGRMSDARALRWTQALGDHVPFTGMSPAGKTRGRVTAPMVGGNLAVLAGLVGTSFFPPIDGCILLLEDVGEAPYRIDRMMTTLRLAGVFDRVVGVVVGDFTHCDPRQDGRTATEVLTERLGDLGLPALMHTPIGHEEEENWEVALGGLVDLDADRGVVTFLQSAVARG